jgi:hypothetical protein
MPIISTLESLERCLAGEADSVGDRRFVSVSGLGMMGT